MTQRPTIPEYVIRQLPQKRQAEGFDVEYRYKYSGTTALDKRTMSFVDNLWGIEVTGGADQFERLTIIAVRRVGLARRAGEYIKVTSSRERFSMKSRRYSSRR